MKNRVFLSAIFIIGCIALGAGLGVYTSEYYSVKTTEKPEIAGFLWPDPRVIQPFEVIDQHNQPFGLDNLQGKWSFLFFGFTHCPDICPITLTLLKQVQDNLALQNKSDNVQMIFVTVDPERDTPEQVAEYVRYFDESFIGLTGTPEQIASLTNQMGVVHIKNEETTPGEYLVDHSASIFLISPAGQWLAIFSAPHNTDDIATRFMSIREFISQQGS